MEVLKHDFPVRGYFRKKAKRELPEQQKAQARAIKIKRWVQAAKRTITVVDRSFGSV